MKTLFLSIAIFLFALSSAKPQATVGQVGSMHEGSPHFIRVVQFSAAAGGTYALYFNDEQYQEIESLESFSFNNADSLYAFLVSVCDAKNKTTLEEFDCGNIVISATFVCGSKIIVFAAGGQFVVSKNELRKLFGK